MQLRGLRETERLERRRVRHWVHRLLNGAVNRFGDMPIVGRVTWWLFGQWQRLM